MTISVVRVSQSVNRRTGYVGEGKKAFLRLKHEVLDQILLRRTKSNRSNDICLPPRIVRVRQHRLDEREEVRAFHWEETLLHCY